MKTIINREKATQLIGVVAPMAAELKHNPILQGVVIECSATEVEFSATMLEAFVTVRTNQATVELVGSVVVNAEALKKTLARMTSDNLVIERVGNAVRVMDERSTVSLPVLCEREKFPVVSADFSSGKTLRVSADELRAALKQVLIATDETSPTPFVKSLIFRAASPGWLFALDGKVAIKRRLDATGEIGSDVMVPVAVQGVLSKLLAVTEDGQVSIQTNDRQARFAADAGFIVSNVFEGGIPDVESQVAAHIGPCDQDPTVSVKELLQAVQAANLCTDAINHGVRIEVKLGMIEVHAKTPAGTAKSVMVAPTQSPATVYVNAKRLIEALKTSNADKVDFGYGATARMMYLREPSRDVYISQLNGMNIEIEEGA